MTQVLLYHRQMIEDPHQCDSQYYLHISIEWDPRVPSINPWGTPKSIVQCLDEVIYMPGFDNSSYTIMI